MTPLKALAALVTVVVLALTVPAPSTGSAMQSVRVGMAVANTFQFLPLQAAPDLNTYKEEGIAPDIQIFQGDAPQLQALAAGAVDIALSSSNNAAAMEKGVPIRFVAGISPSIRFMVLIGGPSIKSVDDLKGKRVGVTSHGAITDWLITKLADTKHWQIGKDIMPTPLGGFSQQVAALRTNQTAGFVWTADGGFQAEKSGIGKILLNFGELVPNFPFEIIEARTAFIRDHPEIVAKFVRAFFKTVALFKHDKDLTVQLIQKYQKFDADVAGKTYDFDITDLSDDGAMSIKGFQNVAAQLLETKAILQPVTNVSVWISKGFAPLKP